MKHILSSFLIVFLFASALYGNEAEKAYLVKKKTSNKWSNFELQQVRLLNGSDFKKMQDKQIEYLLGIDYERLINNVLRAADIPTTAENYGGWQHNGGNGFSNYISGCAMMYASTGDTRLLERVKTMIDLIATSQKKEKLDGYFYIARNKGAYAYDALMRANGNLVTLENNGEDFYYNGAMAGMVFYQLHRVYYGIRDAYYYTGYEPAKDVFLKTMQWVCKWTDLIPDDDKFQQTLEVEHGGISELLVDAYALTGDLNFLDKAQRWTHTLNFRDPSADNVDVLKSRHANVYAPKFMGLILDYQFTENQLNLNAAKNVWDILINNHTLPLGGQGRWERFGEGRKLLNQLGNTSAETCGTNNMLRFSKELFCVLGDVKYMDFYERALYNHILASKNPNDNSIGGGYCYYQSLMPGQCRKYMDDHAFYCCWETGMENHSKYGEAIYFKNDKDILVNLYIPSSLNYENKGFNLEMTGNYPIKDEVLLTVKQNQNFDGDIQFRCPAWMTASDIKVYINNQLKNIEAKSESLLSLSHEWKTGDQIKLVLPSKLRYESSEDPNVCAVFYGPILLASDLGSASNNVINNVWDQDGDTQLASYPDFPNLIGAKDNLPAWISRNNANAMNFSATDGSSLNFIPFYQAYERRVSIYQRFVGNEDQNWSKPYVSDEIILKVNEDTHNPGGRSLYGQNCNRYYKKVNSGNFISYKMKLSPDADAKHWLEVKINGWEKEECGNYDVYVDDVKIGEEGECLKVQQFTFPSKYYEIPKDLAKGKQEVTIRIQQKDTPMYFYGFRLVTDKYFNEYPAKGIVNSEFPIRIQAESTQPNGTNKVFDGLSSAGAYVSRLNSYLQFNNIFIEKPGDYKLKVCYRSSSNVIYIIQHNGTKQEVVFANSNGEWAVKEIEMNMDNLFNTIHIAAKTVRGVMDIDYVEVDKSEGIGIETQEQKDSQIYLYPNPASDFICIKSLADNLNCKITINDISGNTVKTISYPEERCLGIATIPEGVYFAVFEGTTQSTIKFIKK